MDLKELNGKNYIVYFDDTEELSYMCCNEILFKLRMNFPGKKFIGMTKDIQFKDLSDEDVSNLIEILKEIQEQRAEVLTETTIEEVTEEKDAE